jgi:hypothetical protein
MSERNSSDMLILGKQYAFLCLAVPDSDVFEILLARHPRKLLEAMGDQHGTLIFLRQCSRNCWEFFADKERMEEARHLMLKLANAQGFKLFFQGGEVFIPDVHDGSE